MQTLKSHPRNNKNMKDQVSVFSLKPTSSVEKFVFANGNYLDKTKGKRFKGTIINLIEEFFFWL